MPRGDDARAVGQKLIVRPQDIKAFDQDLGLASPVYYTFGGNGGGGNGGGSTAYMANEYKYFELNRNTGKHLNTSFLRYNDHCHFINPSSTKY